MLKPPSKTIKNLLAVKEIIDNQERPQGGCWPSDHNTDGLHLCLEGALLSVLGAIYSPTTAARKNLTATPEYSLLLKAGLTYFGLGPSPGSPGTQLYHLNDRCKTKEQVQEIAAKAVELALQEVE
jgi:hypothetical protein